jgi:prepilin-type processing-associated H-X9-DG protein
MGIIFKMIANENKDMFPELDSRGARLIFTDEEPGKQSVFSEYLTDFTILQCPSDTNSNTLPAEAGQGDTQSVFNRSSYTYLGYVVTNETELKAFVRAYKDRRAKGLRFDTDLDVPKGTGTGGGDKIYRLREGVERKLIKDLNSPGEAARIQSQIPIMWDTYSTSDVAASAVRFNHIPGGSNVLFMDGHVEFIKYPGSFPLTREALRMLSELESLKAQ